MSLIFSTFELCKDNELIKPETIQRIVDTSRIDEVVSDFVSLKKRGTNYVGLCPFHNEKTPSFHVSPSKGIFKCFGCGKGGDSVNFIMEHEHYSYVEALQYLAEKYNVEIEEVQMSSEMKAELSEKETMFAVHQFAQKYFTDNLLNKDEGKQIALLYFKEREFSMETIKKFQLGYGLANWEAFTKEALQSGYTKEQLLKSGLSLEKEGKYYDRFRERVIFPIHNLSGRILGFGGRILTSDKSKAKYINSPETDIYNKSKVLYGIHFAKNAIVKEDNCLLVEGYTDVISMHQAGIENVVSSSGTSLTTDQIRLIKKYTTNITIIYDGDPAGIKASLRGINMVLSEDMNVKIVLLPEPEDPDSFVKKNRAAEVKKYFTEKAQNFILFKTQLLLSEVKNDPILKSKVISEIIEDISLIPNTISRSVYIQECSNLFELPENSLISQLNKILAKRFKKSVQRSSEEQEITQTDEDFLIETSDALPQITVDYYNPQFQELSIIHMLLNHGNKKFIIEFVDEFGVKQKSERLVGEYVISELTNDEIEFINPIYSKFFEEFKVVYFDSTKDFIKHFTSHQDEEIRKLSIDLLSFPYTISPDWETKFNIYTADINIEKSPLLNEYVLSNILKLKLRNVEILIHEMEEKLKTELDSDEVLKILNKISIMNKIRVLLCKKLNITITH